MDRRPTNTRLRLSRGQGLLLALCLLYGALACAVQPRSEVDVHEWWNERGPVVPHASFPDDCSLCHVGQDWTELREDFTFDHGAETGLVLEGAHAEAECLRCHNDRGPVALFAARGCSGCHENYHQGQLGENCEDCHGETNWRPFEQIAMHNRTRLPLVGAHAAAACWSCHEGAQVGDFYYQDPECISCHQDDLARAQNPDHQMQGWVSACDRCHIPTTWSGGGFNHNTFPLTGAHKNTDCTLCHIGNVYAGLPSNCVDCHLPEFLATNDPDHQVLNISTMCQQCHGTSTWLGARFPHTGIVNGCVNCHLPEYQATTSPNHQAQGFSTNCEQCHGTNSWFGANFSHVGITNGCVTCHLPEYNNTTNPNHMAAGFPTSCENCHNTNNWNNAVFAHTFPITSGDHKNLDCTDCHLNPANFQQFSCIHCHEHNQNKMADKHKNEQGYVWTSAACFMCHPDGKE